jgi:hypothetical protein
MSKQQLYNLINNVTFALMDKMSQTYIDIENQAGAIHLLRDFQSGNQHGLGVQNLRVRSFSIETCFNYLLQSKLTSSSWLNMNSPTHNQFFRLFFIKYGILGPYCSFLIYLSGITSLFRNKFETTCDTVFFLYFLPQLCDDFFNTI